MARIKEFRRFRTYRRKTASLKNPAEPNLLREDFPFVEVPRIDFDFALVPYDPPEEFVLTDTTFRDGQQSRPPYTPRQIADLFEFLHRLGGERGLIRQSEFFLYTDKDRKAVELCREKGYRYPEITGWIRAVKKDFALVKEMELRETGILTSISDYHIYLKLNKNRHQAIEEYLSIVSTALEAGIVPRCHLEDITRADFFGCVLPFVQRLMRLSEDARIPIKIRACDTMGYGISYPGASLPRSVPKIIHTLVHEGGVPKERLEWHGHNDFHKGFANATTAWLYGCSAINGTLLGFGERTGNTPLEALVIEYVGLTGDSAGVQTRCISEIGRYFEKELKVRIPPNYPFLGSECNTTRAGVHADGLLKDKEIYSIFDTELILDQPMDVAITDKSGAAGVAFWINTHLSLGPRESIDKRHPGILKIYEWIRSEYESGRVTSISDEEMFELVRLHLPEYSKALKSNGPGPA
jgi:isopropylmalate/homocitrate/citramalate synthase